jgi:hypothetical protein
MAPTKARAMYAVITLSRLTKVMGTLPWSTSLRAINARVRRDVPAEKTAWLRHARNAPQWELETWLKIRKIKALMSL